MAKEKQHFHRDLCAPKVIYQPSCLLNNIIKVYCRSNIVAEIEPSFDIVTLVRLGQVKCL